MLEDNKTQINTQNIQLKSILCNITTDTSHKESKSKGNSLVYGRN